MVEIKLYNNNAFSWYNSNNIFVIGYIEINEKIYEKEQFANYIKQVNTQEELKELLKGVNGYYSIVINKEDGLLMAADVIRSFPVFYQILDDKIIISDDINYFKNKKLDKINEKLFITNGYVIGSDTLYSNISQLEGHQVLYIGKDNKISKDSYFKYKYNVKHYEDDEYVIKELDKLYNNAIKNLIKYLNGRRAVIPLSGGHDSRLIAYYLKRNGYNNILTYTYGRKNNPEADVSKRVAEYLKLEWHFVEYKNKSMQKKYYSEEYSQMANYCARGFSVTHIQEWEAIDYLLKNDIINKNDIIVPGFSGDFIAGSHITSKETQEKAYTNKDLKEYILHKHYNLYNWRKDHNKELENFIWNKIKIELKLEKDKVMNAEELNNLFEEFDFKERQTKFICNSIRIYDMFGIKWYMPLWNKQLMEFWLTIDLKRKLGRNFYYKFANKIYGDLTKCVPIAKIREEKVYKNRLMEKLQKLKKLYTYYFKHFLNYYGYLKFRDYIKYCYQYGSGSYYFMFSCDYIKFIEREGEKNEKS